MANEKKTKDLFLNYRGKPLVRNKNTIYFGYMSEPYVAMLTIVSTDKQDDLDVANNVIIQIMSTDTTIDPSKVVVKRGEAKGIYEALHLSDLWLAKQLSQ